MHIIQNVNSSAACESYCCSAPDCATWVFDATAGNFSYLVYVPFMFCFADTNDDDAKCWIGTGIISWFPIERYYIAWMQGLARGCLTRIGTVHPNLKSQVCWKEDNVFLFILKVKLLVPPPPPIPPPLIPFTIPRLSPVPEKVVHNTHRATACIDCKCRSTASLTMNCRWMDCGNSTQIQTMQLIGWLLCCIQICTFLLVCFLFSIPLWFRVSIHYKDFVFLLVSL